MIDDEKTKILKFQKIMIIIIRFRFIRNEVACLSLVNNIIMGVYEYVVFPGLTFRKSKISYSNLSWDVIQYNGYITIR